MPQRECRSCEQIQNAGFVLSSSAKRVLATIESWPASTLDFNEARASASVYEGADRIGSLDLRRGELVVHAPPDTLTGLHRAFPSGRLRADGLAFDLDVGHDDSAALAALRRRATVERLSWQYREQSP